MGIPLRKFIDSRYVYQCIECSTHLSTPSDVVSRSFNGTLGRAFLFRKVLNVHFGKIDSRKLLTGTHLVRDVFCRGCDCLIGWKYIDADEPSQRYKIDMVVLEKSLFKMLLQSYVPFDLDKDSDIEFLIDGQSEDLSSDEYDDDDDDNEYNIHL